MIYLFYFLNAFLMIAIPIALAGFIAAKRNPGWGLFGIGAVTFVASQVVHIPFNWLVQQRFDLLPTDTDVPANLIILALFLGLSAGLFEEVSRYLTYRYWAKEARTWGKGLMLGAGHGGIEAILLGLLVGVNYIVLVRIQSGALVAMISDEQMPMVQAQIEAMLAAPWYLIILGAVERLFAISFHLSASLLVMQVFIRGQFRWLFAAILWHTLLNALAVFASVTWNLYITEAIIGVMALLSLGVIFWLRTPEPVEPELEPLPEVGPVQPVALETTAEMLDRSRYS